MWPRWPHGLGPERNGKEWVGWALAWMHKFIFPCFWLLDAICPAMSHSCHWDFSAGTDGELWAEINPLFPKMLLLGYLIRILSRTPLGNSSPRILRNPEHTYVTPHSQTCNHYHCKHDGFLFKDPCHTKSIQPEMYTDTYFRHSSIKGKECGYR